MKMGDRSRTCLCKAIKHNMFGQICQNHIDNRKKSFNLLQRRKLFLWKLQKLEKNLISFWPYKLRNKRFFIIFWLRAFTFDGLEIVLLVKKSLYFSVFGNFSFYCPFTVALLISSFYFAARTFCTESTRSFNDFLKILVCQLIQNCMISSNGIFIA